MDTKIVRAVFSPEKDTFKAKKAADQLIDIVKQNKWSIRVGNGDHLKYEAWQTVGKYYNCTVATGEANPIEINNIQGFKAHAWVIDNRTGTRVGEAEAYCMRDEPNWKTKPTFQLASMAQTRAGSKALRQMFGFVVALAGYNPTPAEEMGEEITHAPILPMSEQQRKFIFVLLANKGKTKEDLDGASEAAFHKAFRDLNLHEADLIIEKLNTLPNAVEETEAIDINAIDKELNK